MKKRLNICKIIDQYGWAYYFIAKAQQKFSRHNISYYKIDDFYEEGVDELIKKFNPDVVYFHSPCMAKKKIDALIPQIKAKGIKIIGAYGGETPHIYQYADLVGSISYPHIKNIQKDYGQKVYFLPEAVDTNFFTPNRFNENRFNVGFVGRLSAVKRPHLLKQLDFEIEKKCDWGREYFKDNRTLEPVRDFYRTIDALVLTSESECMPRVILEAMACGLPVVSTDVGCLRMLIEPEWLVPVTPEEETVRAMNEKLNLLKKYPHLRKAVGQRNREHIQKYMSWQHNQYFWDDLFEAVVNEDYKRIDILEEGFLKPFRGLYDVPGTHIIQQVIDKKIAKVESNTEEINKYKSRERDLRNNNKLATSKMKVLNERIKELSEQLIEANREIETLMNGKEIDRKHLEEVKEASAQAKEMLKLKYHIDPIEVISDLQSTTVRYWLLGLTCLEAMRRNGTLPDNTNEYEIGVGSGQDHELLLKRLDEKGYSYDWDTSIFTKNNVQIRVLVNKRERIKDWGLYDFRIFVPLPVLKYLRLRFGEHWKEYGKEKK